MRWKEHLLAIAAVVLAPSALPGAVVPGQDAPCQAVKSPTQGGADELLLLDHAPRADHEPIFLTRGQSPYRPTAAVRFGWWGVETRGNLDRIGEYDGLDPSSPFYDVEFLTSNGDRTAQVIISGTESESTIFDTHFYTPLLTADVDYERFLHRFDHNPLDAWLDTPNTAELAGDDFNIADRYAIRVQKLDARFKGRITENVKWRLNVWGMHKQGSRQATALNHNCTNRQCHMVSQTQRIDWLTMEIEPVIEVKAGPVSAEYSRTMRSFNQSDDLVTRSYTGRPVEFIDPTLQYPYGVVPQNFTQIDRLKLRADLAANTNLYANLFAGDTKNRNRFTHRSFDGFDVRVTNKSFDSLTTTGYFKWYDEDNQLPTTFPEDDLFPVGSKPSEEIRHPIDRETIRGGIKGRWKLNEAYRSRGLALTAGYEYESIDREFASFPLPNLTPPQVFTQPTTISNLVHVGADMRWSASLDTYVRFKSRQVDNPLLGVREADESTNDPALQLPSPIDATALNSKLPQHVELIELGGTWTPTYNFLLSATIGIETTNNHFADRQVVNFDEDSYPIVFTAWYAPTCRWSLSGGLAFYSNWIDQDVTFGNLHQSSRGDEPQDTQPVNYGGRSQVINFGTSYMATDRLTLKGTWEYAHSRNSFFVPSPDGADWSTLPLFSDVLVETNRILAGVDYWLRDGISCYAYYNYYNWDDKASNGESGTANMYLVGVSAVY